jgi:hypothetical protein
MNPRIAVALPVLPALAHAAMLRVAAADLDDRFSMGGFIEVSESLRSISVGLAGFAVVLAVVALLTPGLVRRLGTVLLFASLPVQFLWFEMQYFIAWADLTDADTFAEPPLRIAGPQWAAYAAFVAASLLAIVALRQSRAGRSGGTAGRADLVPTSSTGPAAASSPAPATGAPGSRPR